MTEPLRTLVVPVTISVREITHALARFQRLDALGQETDGRGRVDHEGHDDTHEVAKVQVRWDSVSRKWIGKRIASPQLVQADEVGEVEHAFPEVIERLRQSIVHGSSPHWLAVTVRLGAAGLAGAGLALLATRRWAS